MSKSNACDQINEEKAGELIDSCTPYRVRAFYLGMKPIDSWRPAQTTLLVEVVRGAAGLFVPAAAASIHKTSLFVEHGVQTMIRPRGRKRPPRCTTLLCLWCRIAGHAGAGL